MPNITIQLTTDTRRPAGTKSVSVMMAEENPGQAKHLLYNLPQTQGGQLGQSQPV